MSIIKKIVRKLIRIITNLIIKKDTLQSIMTKREKKLRKNLNIDLNISRSFLDSRCFWFLYNITNSVIKKQQKEKKGGWLLIDAGASNGWYTKLMQKFLSGNNYKFLMYEPLEFYFKENEDYVKKSNGAVYYSKVALGEKDGKVTFYKNNCKGLSSVYHIDKNYKHFDDSFDNQKIEKITVNVAKLDNEIINHDVFNKFKNIFLKMDVQGAEFSILKGAEELLKSGIIKVIHMEMQLIKKYETDYSFIDIISFMLKNDFIVFDIYPGYKENSEHQVDFFGYEGQLTECEIIFIHKKLSLCKVNQ